MNKNIWKILVNSAFCIIKCILLLNMCKSIACNADPNANPKFDDIYSKMCSVLRVTRFCLPYMMGSYPYPFYTLPLPASIPLPIAPFPSIVNPTSPAPAFTIPTIFTTNRPSGPGQLCPPSPPVCPPAAVAMPFIDPRQGNKYLLGTF